MRESLAASRAQLSQVRNWVIFWHRLFSFLFCILIVPTTALNCFSLMPHMVRGAYNAATRVVMGDFDWTTASTVHFAPWRIFIIRASRLRAGPSHNSLAVRLG